MATKQDTVPYAESLRKAEMRLHRLMDLDEEMRRGFVALSGIRMTARPGVLLLLPITWPVTETAELVVDKKTKKLIPSPSADSEARLRQWCGGFKPTPEVFSAQESFRKVLEIALDIVSEHKEF